ncbi:unnamed protein product [Lasius platythorax]|uniref:Uncharacterized protein n=1 Tax=Lasius platythorax TaxID=488582 RepID=A0AAV2NDX6_9HYME
MNEAHPVAIPVNHQDLSLETPSNQSEIVNAPYKEAVGSSLYLTMVYRPDIAYAETIDYGIKFKKNQNLELRAYSDADFAGDKAIRRSTTSYVILLGNTAIAWGVQK